MAEVAIDGADGHDHTVGYVEDLFAILSTTAGVHLAERNRQACGVHVILSSS
jgi:hypothetical protein